MKNPLLLVAAHDAGGAEIVSSWLRRIYYPYPGLKDRVFFCVTGPAKRIFEQKLGPLPPEYQGDPAKVKLALCGSGALELEKDVVEWAMSLGIRTAVWLDHWKNYEQRFRRAPTEIWVADDHAADMAGRLHWPQLQSGLLEQTIQQPKIVIAGNPYLEDAVAEIRLLEEPHEGENVLIVYGPASSGEDIFLWPESWRRRNFWLRHRPHPQDRPSERTLAEDIAWADTVVGWDSMALVVAYTAGRRVVSVEKDRSKITVPIPLEQLYG